MIETNKEKTTKKTLFNKTRLYNTQILDKTLHKFLDKTRQMKTIETNK